MYDGLFGGVSKYNITTTSVTHDQFSIELNIPSTVTLKIVLLGSWTTYFLV